MFGSCSEPIEARTDLEILNISPIRTAATKRRQLTTGRSPLVSTVLATANLLFVEVNHLDFQNQESNACNKWPVYKHPPSCLNSSVDRCTHWILFLRFTMLLLKWCAWGFQNKISLIYKELCLSSFRVSVLVIFLFPLLDINTENLLH